jgi:hypothetical protein
VKDSIPSLTNRLETFGRLASALEGQPADRLARVASFTRDLSDAIDASRAWMAPAGWQIWTVGSRTVGGERVSLDQLVVELMREHDVRHVTTIDRELPSRRRAAARNDRAPRMSTEHVLVFRNPDL